MNTFITLEQAAKLVLSVDNVPFLFAGEPGIGKSSMMDEFKRVLGDTYAYAYVDVPNMDLGDIAMPWINKETNATHYAPSARFKLSEGKPVVILLDEFSKGADPVKNMLHPLLERKPRLGDISLPAGSKVILTGNLADNGLGDKLKAHSMNRIVTLFIRKPDHKQWLNWAVPNGVDASVCAWVEQYPHCLASYMDEGQGDNPYIYNPRRVQGSVVTPRSLALASQIVSAMDKIDTDSLIAALSGAIGEAAARDMQAYVAFKEKLPKWEDIIDKPDTTPVPDSAGATSVLIFNALQMVTSKTLTPFFTYLDRLSTEWQSVFMIRLVKSATKQGIAFTNPRFVKWVKDNSDIL